MKKSSVACAAGAAALIIAAGVVRFGVLPAVDQVPATMDVTVHYSGTASLLNASALSNGDMAHAVETGVPITATRTVKGEAVSGGTILIGDQTVVEAAGHALSSNSFTWSVDRTTLEPANPAMGWTADPHEGLVVGFPLRPAPQNYTYWDTATGTATTADYVGSGQYEGRSAYAYKVQGAGSANSKATAALPKALPEKLVAAMALRLPATQRTALDAYLATAGALIPVAYQAQESVTLWVDTATGVVLSQQVSQAVVAETGRTGAPVELFPVMSISMQPTAASAADALARAQKAQRVLELVGVELPAGLGVLAVLSAAAGVFFGRRRPRSAKGVVGAATAVQETPRRAAQSDGSL